jgi:hypothetical protein
MAVAAGAGAAAAAASLRAAAAASAPGGGGGARGARRELAASGQAAMEAMLAALDNDFMALADITSKQAQVGRARAPGNHPRLARALTAALPPTLPFNPVPTPRAAAQVMAVPMLATTRVWLARLRGRPAAAGRRPPPPAAPLAAALAAAERRLVGNWAAHVGAQAAAVDAYDGRSKMGLQAGGCVCVWGVGGHVPQNGAVWGVSCRGQRPLSRRAHAFTLSPITSPFLASRRRTPLSAGIKNMHLLPPFTSFVAMAQDVEALVAESAGEADASARRVRARQQQQLQQQREQQREQRGGARGGSGGSGGSGGGAAGTRVGSAAEGSGGGGGGGVRSGGGGGEAEDAEEARADEAEDEAAQQAAASVRSGARAADGRLAGRFDRGV